jgi:hypothetical protein
MDFQISDCISVGLITRTSERQPIGIESRHERISLGRLYSAGCTLAGALTWPKWRGPVRYVRRGNP